MAQLGGAAAGKLFQIAVPAHQARILAEQVDNAGKTVDRNFRKHLLSEQLPVHGFAFGDVPRHALGAHVKGGLRLAGFVKALGADEEYRLCHGIPLAGSGRRRHGLKQSHLHVVGAPRSRAALLKPAGYRGAFVGMDKIQQ